MVLTQVEFIVGMVDGKVTWRARSTAMTKQPTSLFEAILPSEAARAGLAPEELNGYGLTMEAAAADLSRLIADYAERHAEAVG